MLAKVTFTNAKSGKTSTLHVLDAKDAVKAWKREVYGYDYKDVDGTLVVEFLTDTL